MTTIVRCERFYVESITEMTYDPNLGLGSPLFPVEVTVRWWQGRTAPDTGLDFSATASNSPSDTWTKEENLQRMTDWLQGAVLESIPDAVFEWADAEQWMDVGRS